MTDRRTPRALRWCTEPDKRWFVLAVAAGFALRLGWVLWVHAVTPLEPSGDTGRNLAMAQQFSHLETYRLHGLVSAYNPPGYSFLLTPVALVSRLTGWFELPIGAALVNVAAGTATVALGGVLAGQWFDRRARTATAWILALAAGPIYLTVVALTETVFTALVLAVLVVLSTWLRQGRVVSRGSVAGVAVLIGFGALVRAPALLLVLVTILALRQARGSWRAARRPAAALVAIAVVVVLPWTIRNVVQVGVLTPVATNSAAFVCQGHGPDAKADVDDMTADDFAYCFRGSPFDPTHHDEPAWASHITRRALAWAIRHPLQEVDLTWDKTYATMVNDHQALADARDGARRDFGSTDAIHRLDRIGEWWHRFVLAFGALALVVLPAARRAWPLWATSGAFVMAVWVGNALDRYHHTTMALLAVFAGATVASIHPRRRWRSATMGWRRRRLGREEQRAVQPEQQRAAVEPTKDDDAVGARTAPVGRSDPARRPEHDDEPPLSPEEAMAQAARPAGIWAGWYGVPLHPALASVAVGAWICAFGFDLISQVADTAWVYARGAYVLTAAGVGVGVLAATIGLADLVRIPRGTRAFQTGVRHLLVMDACLVLFAISFLIRRGSDFAWHDGVDVLPMGLSIFALVLLAAGVWLGTRLAYTYGVRVADDADRLGGFSPLPARDAPDPEEPATADA